MINHIEILNINIGLPDGVTNLYLVNILYLVLQVHIVSQEMKVKILLVDLEHVSENV